MDEIITAVSKRIESISAASERKIIAIDGRCASGKTTLAAALEKELGCTVFHMDDFFLRPEQRTPERLSTPGENVDHERFCEEILFPLLNGDRIIVYRPFDCVAFELTSPRSTEAGSIVIIEGSYSCHPALWNYCDLHIFLTLSPSEQMDRVIRREGAERAVTFRDRWIPMEEKYFKTFQIAQQCELCFDTGKEPINYGGNCNA